MDAGKGPGKRPSSVAVATAEGEEVFPWRPATVHEPQGEWLQLARSRSISDWKYAK